MELFINLVFECGQKLIQVSPDEFKLIRSALKKLANKSSRSYIRDMVKVWSREMSSKFGAYEFLVFSEILALNSNPSIFDYASRDSSPYWIVW
jgi:hypothetical protein